jgi:hypothetical protein
LQSKNFLPDKRHPGDRSRYGKYGPRSGYGFLRTACQPIRIENFEKPYNNKQLLNEVEYDIENYEGQGLCYPPNSKAGVQHNQGLDNKPRP